MLIGWSTRPEKSGAVSSRPLLVLTTCATSDEASRLATALVEQRLAACVNTVETVTSTYRWQDAVQRGQESLLLIKTTEARFPALEQAIRERSSYEVPEILAIPVHGGSASYLGWLGASVTEGKE
jgi:periplasmic divalent cation tolerance protein